MSFDRESFLSALRDIVGQEGLITDETTAQNWSTDWTKLSLGRALAVVLPKTTAEVSSILKRCHENEVAVVPSGGRTGLAGGAVAKSQELVISLSRMNKILHTDCIGLSILTEAGVTTQSLQEEAAQNNLSFPIDLAAKGSCQIGGNIATNAGGLKFIRYGGTREQVIGLEVVLADGTILNLNNNLRKNNTGYDLKQLFIGSEGTLGIITKATLRLVAKPADTKLAFIGLNSFENILSLFHQCNLHSLTIAAFEYLTLAAYHKVLNHFSQSKRPFDSDYPYMVLLEIEEQTQSQDSKLEALLEEAFEKGVIENAVLSESSQESTELWALRENISEAIAMSEHVRKNDISVPISSLAKFSSSLETIRQQTELSPHIEVLLFGHIGDGNIHINYIASEAINKDTFNDHCQKLELQIFDLIEKLGGSISAEHGIGILKRSDLKRYKCPSELIFMRGIKKGFDPKGIMNPDKIFDLNP